MTPEMLQDIARRFEFERWAGANTLGRGLFVRNYRIPPPAPGWELVRAWNVPAIEDAPPALQTLWSFPAAGEDALLRIDVYECASRQAAHQQMLRLLGEYQVEGPEGVEQGDLGDVFTITGQGQTAVFARGNLVIFIARAGRQPTETRAIATGIDSDIVFEPAPELGRSVAPATARAFGVEGGAAAASDKVELDVDDTTPMTVKVFADGGELEEENGRIEMRVTDPDRANAVVYTLPVEGGPSRRSVEDEEKKQ